MDHGQSITIRRPDGRDAPGVLFSPADDAPGVVLIQEWWGVNAQIRGVGQRLADAGYRVLIPDLYHGRAASTPDEARHLMRGLDFADAVTQDVAGAIAYLKGHAPSASVGIMGFCMGGGVAIAALCNLDGLAGGVAYYGIPPAEVADPSELRAPLQGHYAEFDSAFTPQAVHALEDALRRGRVEYELYRYASQHAFFNEARPEVYDPTAATDAWRRTLDFFRRHLGGPAS